LIIILLAGIMLFIANLIFGRRECWWTLSIQSS
jgi:hypothetical protein